MTFCHAGINAATVLVEAESFEGRGGWVIDPQFLDLMGSPYLLAHGLGNPVARAKAKVLFSETATYYVWVRTKNWVPEPQWAPGTFKVHVFAAESAGKQVISVDAFKTQSGREIRFKAPLFIDCTGDGSVGFLAGAAADLCRQYNATPREIGKNHIRELQKIVFGKVKYVDSLKPRNERQE